MPDARAPGAVPRLLLNAGPRGTGDRADDPVACDRCGAAMFRMHAVWRCPACGFKTDCCGW